VACQRDNASLWLWAPAFAGATSGEIVARDRRPTRPLADMANEPSKKSFVYAALSFRVYDWNCPRLDTEWLLSTLFDASLLSTFKAAGFPAALFLRPRVVPPSHGLDPPSSSCPIRRKPY